MQKKFRMEAPQGETKLLLHTCCAPCSSAMVERLLANGVQPTLIYYNPNIFPAQEYEKRKAECVRYARILGLPFVDAESDHATWLETVKGLESEPERGARCLQCFKMRLKVTALYANDNGFKVFATTLAASRWKDLKQIEAAGASVAALFPDLVFWAQNWRKGGLLERRNELIKTYGFYNQSYCGCEFSRDVARNVTTQR